MPKIPYTWAFWATVVAYCLKTFNGFNFDLFDVLVSTFAFILFWNAVVTAWKKDIFSFVHKSRYDELEKQFVIRIVSLKKQLKEANELSEQEKEALIVEAQDAVFEAYVNDKKEFAKQLNLYCIEKGYSQRYKADNKKEEKEYSKTNSENNANKETFGWRAVLGVTYLAGKDEVDAAYKSLVRKYHPDVNKDPSAIHKMTEINVAKDQADKYFAKAT